MEIPKSEELDFDLGDIMKYIKEREGGRIANLSQQKRLL